LGGGHWNLNGLGAITVLFGKNGSGKSLLLRAWRDASPETNHYVVPERGGEISYEATFLAQQLDPRQRREVSVRNFVEAYRRQVVSRIQSYFAVRGNVRGSELPGDPSEIETALSQLLPDFSLEMSAVRTPPYRIIRTANQQEVGNIDQLSSGAIDIKSLIEEISLALDPKRLHWTIRVARTIGAARPTGQLAVFLGGEVLSALWPEQQGCRQRSRTNFGVEALEEPLFRLASAPSPRILGPVT
jgi:hypothetical protein